MKYLLFIIFLHVSLFSSTVSLTQEEKKWLQEHPVIKVGFDYSFAPFEYVDEDDKVHGVSGAYLAELTKILGVKFDIVKNRNWPEVHKMAQEGELDILTCIVPTEQRREYLNFTNPYLTFPMVIVTNKNTGFINGIKELNNKTVAVIDSYTPHQILQKHYPKVHIVKTKNLKEALELVAAGKTFAHVGNLSRVTYLLKERGFRNLAITGITQYEYNFSIGIKKGDPTLNSIIKKAFNAIPQEVHNKIYNTWFPINYKQAQDYTFLIYVAVASAIVITLISFWLFLLKKEVKRRKLVENQLKKNVKWLNTSLKKAHVGAWHWDLRTGITTGNSVYASILGVEDEEFEISAKDFQKNFIHPEDLSMVLKELEDYFSGKISKCSARFRIYTKGGELKTIESKGEIFEYDAFNNPAVMFGFIVEIKD